MEGVERRQKEVSMTRDGLVGSTCATRSGLSFQCNMLVLLHLDRVSCYIVFQI